MKLSLVTSGLFRYTGGPPVVIANLLNKLAKENNIHTTCLGIDGEVHPNMLNLNKRIDSRIFKPFTAYRFSYSYAMSLIKTSPDVVWVHGMWLWPNLVGIIYSVFGKKRLVLTPHGVLTKQMFSNKWYKKIIIGFPELLSLVLKNNTTIHYLSEAEKEACILKSFNVNSVVIPNFVQVNVNANIDRTKGFVFLARIAPIKGIEDILSIENNKCDIFGFGDSKYIQQTLGDNENYKGEVESSEVGNIFSQYNFYVLPSYGEGLPTSAIEAAFSGCILIISHECNLNMFDDGVDCIKFYAGKDNFAKAIRKAKNLSLESMEIMRANSLEKVKSHFGEEGLINEYRRLLKI